MQDTQVSIGDRFRVRSTPLTREFGLNHAGRPHEQRAWPGMVGVVVEETYTDMLGNPVTVQWLDFDNGIRYPFGSYGTLSHEECLVAVPSSRPVHYDCGLAVWA